MKADSICSTKAARDTQRLPSCEGTNSGRRLLSTSSCVPLLPLLDDTPLLSCDDSVINYLPYVQLVKSTGLRSGLSSALRPNFAISTHVPFTLTRTRSNVKSVFTSSALRSSDEPTPYISTGTASCSKRSILATVKPPLTTIFTL